MEQGEIGLFSWNASRFDGGEYNKPDVMNSILPQLGTDFLVQSPD